MTRNVDATMEREKKRANKRSITHSLIGPLV